jgi:hypothetical protein
MGPICGDGSTFKGLACQKWSHRTPLSSSARGENAHSSRAGGPAYLMLKYFSNLVQSESDVMYTFFKMYIIR